MERKKYNFSFILFNCVQGKNKEKKKSIFSMVGYSCLTKSIRNDTL